MSCKSLKRQNKPSMVFDEPQLGQWEVSQIMSSTNGLPFGSTSNLHNHHNQIEFKLEDERPKKTVFKR